MKDMGQSTELTPEAGTDPGRPARGAGPLAALRVPDFALLFAGQACSLVGDQFAIVALPFLVLSHAGAATLGEVLMTFGIARIAAIPLGGQLADRLGRTRTMLCSDAVRLLVVAVLAVSGSAPLWLLLVTVAVLGAAEGAFLPAAYAVIPDVLEDDLIVSGNALIGGATSAAALIGPAIAGLVVSAAGPGLGFAVDAVTFAVSVASLLALAARRAASRQRRPVAAPDGGERQEPGIVQVLQSSRILQVSLVITLVASLANGGISDVVLPVFSQRSLDLGSSGYGVLLASFGTGAVLGSLGAGRLAALRRRGTIALCLGIAQGIGVMLVPAGNSVWVGALSLVVVGATNGMCNVFYVSMLQQRLAPAVLGRAMSVLMLTATGTFPLSVALAGQLVGTLGVTTLFLVDGLLICGAFAIGFGSREYRSL